MTLSVGCFHLQNKTLVNGVQDMNQKIINHGILLGFGDREYFQKYVGNPQIYQVPESNCFIAARAIGAHKELLPV